MSVDSNMNSVFITLIVKCFLQSSEISRMCLINKNAPAKRDKMFIWDKKVLPNQDLKFMKVGYLWDNSFSYKPILILQ